MSISLWDAAGYGEVYAGDGCYVVRYENGKRVEAWGPYATQKTSENARRRLRRGSPNLTDHRLHNSPQASRLVHGQAESTKEQG